MEDICLICENLKIYNKLVKNAKYQWDDSDLLLEFLKDSFKYYNSCIKSLDGYVKYKVLKNQDIIFCLFPKIIETVLDYLRGKIPSAYDSMREAFECINDLLVRKSTTRFTTGLEFGFKARVLEEGALPPCLRDMLHIPFEKRHLVKDQPYIHGIPSIYLGRSIYDCYLELGKPSLNEFWVSFFCFSQDKKNILNSQHIRLVDLTFADKKHDLELLWHSLKEDEESCISTLDQLVDDILLWPLMRVQFHANTLTLRLNKNTLFLKLFISFAARRKNLLELNTIQQSGQIVTGINLKML